MPNGTYWLTNERTGERYGLPVYDNGDGTYNLLSKTLVDGKPRVSAMPYLYDIAEGNVAGHSSWNKIGFNGDVGTTEEDIWTVGGVYAFPPAGGIQMQVVSSSVNDDGAPVGTGALTVTIYYLNASYVSKTEVVTMDGTTPVNTVATDIFRVNGFRCTTCGTGGKAAGTITLKNTAATVTYGQIVVGYTRARNSSYTVALGKTLYVTSLLFSVHSATKGVRFTTRVNYDPDAAADRDFFVPWTEVCMTNGTCLRPLEIPSKIPATRTLKVSAVADAVGAVCSVALRGWLE